METNDLTNTDKVIKQSKIRFKDKIPIAGNFFFFINNNNKKKRVILIFF
jgi:hypothetical protein